MSALRKLPPSRRELSAECRYTFGGLLVTPYEHVVRERTSTFAASGGRGAGRPGADGATGVAQQAAQQLLALLDLDPIGLGEPGVLRIRTPPALEPPEALVSDAQPRYARAASARVPGLEVEEALEHRRRAGAVGLALSGIEQDHARRSRPDLISLALGPSVAIASGLRRPGRRAAIRPRLDLTLRAPRGSR